MSGEIIALLGPTNTGKTTKALEMMLSFETGIMGFPLRLLARENYDILCRKVGEHRVSLITGEERIIPSLARYCVATVEAMPLQKHYDFMAVDEIQMIDDLSRGHIFTDRLLYHRGIRQTVFVGSKAVEKLIVNLIPEIEIRNYQRLSKLQYTGREKLPSLNKRTAIIGFSAKDVYSLGDMIKSYKGGAAIVMGSMSPHARRAQVELFQSGEVDYLIATDAIGMGLNLTIDNVAFSQIRKFDGQSVRSLNVMEIGQIAGRAGRGNKNGFFGITGDSENIPLSKIKAVEENSYPNLKKAFWRYPHIDLSSPSALLKSLKKKPPSSFLIKSYEVDDEQALTFLAKRSIIKSLATNPKRVKLLWEVCQIPDYEKLFYRKRLLFLEKIYILLCQNDGIMPSHLLEQEARNLENVENDIFQIMQNLGRIRTWSYMAHQHHWLQKQEVWREQLLQLEIILSEKLHRLLVDRFVSIKKSYSRDRGEKVQKIIENFDYDHQNAKIVSDGQILASIRGLSLVMEPSSIALPREMMLKTLAKQEKQIVLPLLDALNFEEKPSLEKLEIELSGKIRWRGGICALFSVKELAFKKSRGKNIDFQVKITAEWLSYPTIQKLKNSCLVWLKKVFNNDFHIIDKMENILKNNNSEACEINLIEKLREGLGIIICDKEDLLNDLKILKKRSFFKKNLRVIKNVIYVPKLLETQHIMWRYLMIKDLALPEINSRIFKITPLNNSNRGVFHRHKDLVRRQQQSALLTIGYELIGNYALRFDLASSYRTLARKRRFSDKQKISTFKGDDTNLVESFLSKNYWVFKESFWQKTKGSSPKKLKTKAKTRRRGKKKASPVQSDK